MKASKTTSFYKFALLLSVAIHLFFLTSAGIIPFSKKDQPGSAFASFLTVQLESFNEPLKVKAKEMIRLSAPPPAIQKPVVKVHQEKSGVFWNFKKFKKDQTRLDQRLKVIKKEIIEKQVRILQSVSPSVYDAEKVPAEMRTSVLPEYLKQMRLKISAVWLPLLDSIHCDSCIAIVEYRIDHDGRISKLKLLKSSPDPDFDRACGNAVVWSNPLPALPFEFKQEVKDEYLTVSLTFYFENKKPVVDFPS